MIVERKLKKLMKNERFVIVDGNALVHRAYHAIPPLSTKEGLSVNAVYGFTSILLKILQDLNPSHIAVSFDVAGGTFRDDIYEDYKATRVKADDDLYNQIPYCYEVVEALDIPIFTKEGYEADDVIGTLVTEFETRNAKLESVIVTGDKDLLQLVDDQTKVYLLKKGMSDFQLYDEKAVQEKFGFLPKMMIDYKALMGDSSDNIPGVKGVGQKTAMELLEKIGSVEEIYQQLKDPKSKIKNAFKPAVLTKLENGEGDARMSYTLATIITDVPGLKFKLEDAKIRELDKDKILTLFQRFEFVSLMKRLPGEVGETVKKEKKKHTFVTVDEKNFDSVWKKILAKKYICVKEILTSENVMNAELSGLVFCVAEEIFYIELKHINETQQKKLFDVFAGDTLIIGHDLKQLLKAFFLKGISVSVPLFDVMIASYLINSSVRAHDMKSIVLKTFGKELKDPSLQKSLFGTDPKAMGEEVGYYEDLYHEYEKKLEQDSNLGLFNSVEMALIPVLARMEISGICVDKKRLEQLSKESKKSLEKLTKKIHELADEEFNIASSMQLRDILYEKLGLPTEGVKKGKTGYSTAAAELEKLRDAHPIIPLIEEFRELEKLRNTYIDVLPTLINTKTGRIHTSFNQAVATTGRLSGSDPNLQNIPIRTQAGREIRKCFISEKGKVLVAADYSQIELRVVASLAKDEKMIEIFKKGEDIHSATAAAINGVSLDEVTKDMRRAAKEVNFGVLYGMGAHGLSWRAGIPHWQAQEFIEGYFKTFSGVKKYMDATLALAKKDGYVETLFGRRRYIPELHSSNFQIRNSGERMAINMPVQGTAADIMKMAMIELHKKLESRKSKDKNETNILLQVHDELVLETPVGEGKEIAKLVQKTMEEVVKLEVPVEVHVETGTSWGEMK
ncbi:MAG: DNA polymerase I [Candidatus Magasanikbacteria bacterium CG11_big_fil_rev_8_21_14_0_20_39_34]|uniref:DNA polymerase I n=1 Tax=Candidatus Magasanikbacteria bacterium CG11_big_fil_rev_8_21_14_0_20_39_34 TaxID=1974653 RepID=A0A2H0N8X1_9BACT|nr:MAG: DNA polymerase I [Candidatus Magasanikbacteria bacterium CG11_big_fil_rev_8_21_14_0_20_39_34]